ncbi:hypothetical protein N7492_004665 [Penicillium capsulatum]|uniref:Uncharacterized protein n=1 Tax=Penicillium capsulatum TaxID=69766 RepID=A0A9W9IBY8_9EURO|nr:hypothetical protein N7492_004665 [Penicillium capsulatum]KAJ6136224.1 hypothetical protein N7512_001384 [Penicillium capsulatum]
MRLEFLTLAAALATTALALPGGGVPPTDSEEAKPNYVEGSSVTLVVKGAECHIKLNQISGCTGTFGPVAKADGDKCIEYEDHQNSDVKSAPISGNGCAEGEIDFHEKPSGDGGPIYHDNNVLGKDSTTDWSAATAFWNIGEKTGRATLGGNTDGSSSTYKNNKWVSS